MNENLNREIIEIPIEDIVPNRFQPRLTFDIEALNDLANSIKEHGIIQPLVVRKLQDKYEIIAGERRYKAASLLGMQKVPCIVMNLNDNESAEVAVVENIQRKEMSPLEEARSFKKILDKGYLTQDELAKRMGKSQSSVANKLRLLNLDEIVQEAILNGKISERHARSLLRLENKVDQRNVLNEIIEKRLTVRQTDDLLKEKYNIGTSNNMNNGINNDTVNNIFSKMNSNMSNNVNNNIFGNTNSNTGNSMNNDVSNIFKEPIVEEKSVVKKENEYQGFKSTPEVILPVNTGESNPQLDIINGQNRINMESAMNNSNEFNNNQNKDIQNIINPSVFSDSNFSTNDMVVDINQVKNNAQDIIQKHEPTVNVSNLMSTDKPKNKFFVDLNMNYDNFNDQLPDKIKNAVDSINRKVEEIKLQGIIVNKEEKDLGSSYQIIIRIDK